MEPQPTQPHELQIKDRQAGQGEAWPSFLVLAYSLDPDCPWEVTNSADDVIDFADFQASWEYDGHDMPGRESFSRLIQQLERPNGSGSVGKIPTLVRYDARHGTRTADRSRPFKYVAWKA